MFYRKSPRISLAHNVFAVQDEKGRNLWSHSAAFDQGFSPSVGLYRRVDDLVYAHAWLHSLDLLLDDLTHLQLIQFHHKPSPDASGVTNFRKGECQADREKAEKAQHLLFLGDRMFVLDFSNVEMRKNPDHTGYREMLIHDKRFRIVEYEENASHPDWCSKGHHGFVIEGEIMYELEKGSARVRAGNGFLILPGTRHRGHNVFPGITRFFLVDD